MARLTLRLPNSLHAELTRRAGSEGVSRDQLVVCALSREIALQSLEEQCARFERLRSRFPGEEAGAALARMLADRHA